MAQKGRIYYRHRKDSSRFKQIIRVLSDPFEYSGRCRKYNQMAVKAEIYKIDYNGFSEEISDHFCNFPYSGENSFDDEIKPIEEVSSKELKAFLVVLFEELRYE